MGRWNEPKRDPWPPESSRDGMRYGFQRDKLVLPALFCFNSTGRGEFWNDSFLPSSNQPNSHLPSIVPRSVQLGTASVGLVVLYPLMKRITYWPQAFLAVVFNWGVLLGFSAVQVSHPQSY